MTIPACGFAHLAQSGTRNRKRLPWVLKGIISMSYRDFTLEILRHRFGVRMHDCSLFTSIGELVPSARLQDALQMVATLPITSEKSRSEFIVAPVLIDCRERLQRRFNIYSGYSLNADMENGLNGECDFILARSASKLALLSPLMLILEAKKHDIEENLGQCVAQMIGANRFNERDGIHLPYIYGCVTTGEAWQFMRLQGTDLQLHSERLPIGEIGRILWFIVQCLNDLDQQVSEAA
jgi:hypothetical protein